MSADDALVAAVAAVLRDGVGLGALNGVFEGPPVKAALPYAEIGEVLGTDWSTKDRAGRELRIAVTLRDAGRDAGDGAVRARALGTAAAAAIEALPRMIGGWSVGSVTLARSRVAGTAPGRWAVTLDYRVRMLAG